MAKLVNPLVHRGNNLMGADMGWRLEEAGKSGVIFGYSFDAYWPGGTRNTGWWKNMFGVLTEVASARVATPMDVDPTELRGGTKGLITYEQQINFPNPWPGGVWRLRDIMDYELIVSDAALETVSKWRAELLRGVASMAAYAVSSADPAVCWRIPLEGQRDPIEAARLAALLLDHGVEVRLAADKKSFLVATAQPYGRFVDEMMGIQRYPEVHPAAGSGILEPYDVAAWSLPLMMGVRAERAKVSAAELAGSSVLQSVPWPAAGLAGSGKYFSVAGQQNNIFALTNAMQKAGADVYLARGKGEAPAVIFAAHPDLAASAERLHLQLRARADLPEGASKLKPVRLGLFKPYIASLDEGWTRFILEQYGFPTKNLENKEVKAGNLNAAYDVIILPDSPRNVIVEGRGGFGGEGFGGEFPPEYTGGIGKEGLKALGEFVENGGTLIALANASSVLTGEEFNLPVRNTFASGEAVRGAQATGINIPGSLLRVYVDPNHPVGYGMPGEIAAFFDAPLAFETSPPSGDVNRSVVAWYPESAKDILVSGYARGADRLEHKAAIVAFTKGKGKIVLFGFRTQFRAQTEGTFQLLFNAIRWAAL